MDCLLKNIGETIQLRFNEIIENYTLKICEKYGLNYDEVLNLLSVSSDSNKSQKTIDTIDTVDTIDTIDTVDIVKAEITGEVTEEVTPKTEVNVTNVQNKVEPVKCKYIFTKGEKQGQKCSHIVRDGSEFCTKHKPKEKKSKAQSVSNEQNTIDSEKKIENEVATTSTNTNSVNVTDSSYVKQKVDNIIYGDPWVALQTLEVEKILEILQRTPEPSPKGTRKRSANDSKEINKGRKNLPSFDNDSESEIEEEM